MYHSACSDDTIPAGEAVGSFSCFSFHGQSGSPVWLYDTDTGERTVRGVVTHRNLTSASDAAAPGFFTIMSEQVFDDINFWMSQALAKLAE